MSVSTALQKKRSPLAEPFIAQQADKYKMLSFADLHAGYIIMANFMHGSVLRLGIALFLTQNAVNYF